MSWESSLSVNRYLLSHRACAKRCMNRLRLLDVVIYMPRVKCSQWKPTAVGPASHCWAKWHHCALFPFSEHSLQWAQGAMISTSGVGIMPLMISESSVGVSIRRMSERAHLTKWYPHRVPSSATSRNPPGWSDSIANGLMKRKPQAITVAEARALLEGSSDKNRCKRTISYGDCFYALKENAEWITSLRNVRRSE